MFSLPAQAWMSLWFCSHRRWVANCVTCSVVVGLSAWTIMENSRVSQSIISSFMKHHFWCVEVHRTDKYLFVYHPFWYITMETSNEKQYSQASGFVSKYYFSFHLSSSARVGGLDSLSASTTRWYCFNRHLPASSAPLRHRPQKSRDAFVFNVLQASPSICWGHRIADI